MIVSNMPLPPSVAKQTLAIQPLHGLTDDEAWELRADAHMAAGPKRDVCGLVKDEHGVHWS